MAATNASTPSSSSSSSFLFPFLFCIFALLGVSAASTRLPAPGLKPGHQLLHPNAPVRRPPVPSISSHASWSVQISHRDSLLPPLRRHAKMPLDGLQQDQDQDQNQAPPPSSSSVPHVLPERLSRDAARVAALAKRLQIAVLGERTSEWKPLASSTEEEDDEKASSGPGRPQQDFSSPIVSGLSQGSGEYFTRFGLGTPPRYAYFVMDTGSDLSWSQCQPCQRCYNQSDPFFNPSSSSSYQSIPCGTPLCSQLLLHGCQSNTCLYQVSYGDGSFTFGDFALEKFTFGKGSVVLEVAIGCGHDNEGLFQGASGLLGLGNGKLSFPSQTKAPFSYCLADRFQGGASELIFGREAAPRGSVFTPMLKNPKLSTFYFVGLDGISVGGQRLQIPASVFQIGADGSGGVIVDSGTSITRLTAPAYVALREAFVAATSDLPSAASVSLFDTCYALGGMTSVSVPTVDFHYAGQATTRLPAANYLIPVDTSGTFCFAFAGTNAAFSIIGNMQQQGYRVSFDAAAGRIGFAPNQC